MSSGLNVTRPPTRGSTITTASATPSRLSDTSHPRAERDRIICTSHWLPPPHGDDVGRMLTATRATGAPELGVAAYSGDPAPSPRRNHGPIGHILIGAARVGPGVRGQAGAPLGRPRGPDLFGSSRRA